MNSPLAAIEKRMNIILVFGILLFSIAIIETILSGTWNRYYFLYGIPIYSKEIEISDLNKTSQLVIHFIDILWIRQKVFQNTKERDWTRILLLSEKK